MGNSVNSWSQPTNHCWIDPERMQTFTFERTFKDKGLFIIPYNLTRVLAAMSLEFELLSITNEYRDLKSNPELSFYGYCHVRRFKQAYGSPVQINLRSQELFWWNPLESYQSIDIIGTLINAIDPLELTETFGRLLFPAPKPTDFSFGFKQSGQYKAILKLHYWDDDLWEELRLPKPDQPLPDTSNLENLPPPGKEVSPNPTEPYSEPYDRETGDFGESDPFVEPPPPEPGETVDFRVQVDTLIPQQIGAQPTPFTAISQIQSGFRQPFSLGQPFFNVFTLTVPVNHFDGVVNVPVLSSGAFETEQNRQIALDNAVTQLLLLE